MFLSSNLYSLTHELFGELGDVCREPSVKGETLHIFMGAEYHNEIFSRIDRAVRQTDRDEDLSSFGIDESQ